MEEMEYAILYRKIKLKEDTFLFIPINVLKGVSIDYEFCDEVGNIYTEIGDVSYIRDDDFYVSDIVSYEELYITYDSNNEENLKNKYFSDYKTHIVIATLDENQDLQKRYINIEENITNNYNEELVSSDNLEVDAIIDLKSIKEILYFDGDNVKKLLKNIVYSINPDDIENIDKVYLNLNYTCKLLIEDIHNRKRVVNNKYNIEKNDIKLIKKLFSIEKSILELYGELYNLEFKNQKNSEEYTKKMDYLNISVDTEKEIFENLDLSFEKAISILEYIINIPTKNIENEIYCSEIDSIFVDKYDLYINRIIRRLTKYILEEYDILSYKVNPKLINLLATIYGNEIKGYTDHQIIDSLEVNKLYENQILKKLINEVEKTDNILSLNLKYNTAFLNEDLECELMSNKPYKYKDFDISKYNYDKDLVDFNRNTLCGNLMLRDIFYILTINEDEYKNSSVKNLIELIKIRLNILKDLADDYIIEIIQEQINNYVLENTSNNIKIIDEIFNKNKQYKK